MYESFLWIALGEWGTRSAQSISTALANTAIALVFAILAFRLVKLAIHTILHGSAGQLLFDCGALFVRAVVLAFIINSWPSFMQYIQQAQRYIAQTAIGSSSPLATMQKVLVTMDYYETLIANGTANWAVKRAIQDNAVNGQKPDPSLWDSLKTSAASAFSLLTSLASTLANLPATAMLLLCSVLAACAVWFVSGIIVVAMAMPLTILFVALAVAPLAIAAYMSEDQLSKELVAGWTDIIFTTLLAFPILMILVSLMEPALSGSPKSVVISNSDVSRLSEIGADLSMLVFFGTFMAMPMAIASGIINGRVPSANPAFILFGLVWGVVKGVTRNVVPFARIKSILK